MQQQRSPVAPAVVLVLSLVFFALLLARIQNPISYDDGLRHLTYARLLAEKGILGMQGWGEFLYEGYFSKHVLDPWFLADILYLPLRELPTARALHMFTLFSLSSIGVSFYLVLRRYILPSWVSCLLVLMLFFGEPSFTMRILLARPFSLMTAIGTLAVGCVVARKTWAPLLLMPFAVLLSQLFVFPLAFLLIGCVWLWFIGERRTALLLLATTILGSALGFALHPHPAEYVEYVFLVFLRIPFQDLPLGSEMYSAIGRAGHTAIPAMGVVAFVVACWYGLRKKNLQHTDCTEMLYLAILTIGLFLAMLIWMRAIDLLWPILLLCIGASFPIFRAVIKAEIPATWRGTKLSRETTLLLMLLMSLNSALMFMKIVAGDPYRPHSSFASAAHIPAGSRVLNLSWGAFPPLLSHNPRVKYSMGIDVTFTHLVDPDVTRLLASIEQERLKEEDADVDANRVRSLVRQLLSMYESDYLVLTRGYHDRLLEPLRQADFLTYLPAEDLLATFTVQNERVLSPAENPAD